MRLKTFMAAAVVVTITGICSSANAATPSEAKAPDTPAPAVAVVQPGDTLSAIAEVHQTTYVRLFDANLQIADPDIINPGDNVRIPAADEQLPDRPLPADAAPATPVTATPAAPAAYTAPAASAAPAVSTAGQGIWDRLAQCESGGNWAISTGNGFYGGLQFTASSWAAAGGSGLPSMASREEQIARAQILQARQGWGAWPACSAKLGLY